MIDIVIIVKNKDFQLFRSILAKHSCPLVGVRKRNAASSYIHFSFTTVAQVFEIGKHLGSYSSVFNPN